MLLREKIALDANPEHGQICNRHHGRGQGHAAQVAAAQGAARNRRPGRCCCTSLRRRGRWLRRRRSTASSATRQSGCAPRWPRPACSLCCSRSSAAPGMRCRCSKLFLPRATLRCPSICSCSSGDVPLIRPETIRAVCETHVREHAAMTILTAVPPDPTGYGRVLRVAPGQPEVMAIVEQKSLTPAQLGTPEINSGIYCFETEALFSKLDSLSTDNPQAEYYLTDVAAMLVASGQRVVAVEADSVDEVLGANTIGRDDASRPGNAARLGTASDGPGRHDFQTRYVRDRCAGGGRGRHGDRALRAVAWDDSHRRGVPHPVLRGHPEQ